MFIYVHICIYISKATGKGAFHLVLPEEEHEHICNCHNSLLYNASKVQITRTDLKFYKQLIYMFNEIGNKIPNQK